MANALRCIYNDAQRNGCRREIMRVCKSIWHAMERLRGKRALLHNKSLLGNCKASISICFGRARFGWCCCWWWYTFRTRNMFLYHLLYTSHAARGRCAQHEMRLNILPSPVWSVCVCLYSAHAHIQSLPLHTHKSRALSRATVVRGAMIKNRTWLHQTS